MLEISAVRRGDAAAGRRASQRCAPNARRKQRVRRSPFAIADDRRL